MQRGCSKMTKVPRRKGEQGGMLQKGASQTVPGRTKSALLCAFDAVRNLAFVPMGDYKAVLWPSLCD